jgi:hypothetical protein
VFALQAFAFVAVVGGIPALALTRSVALAIPTAASVAVTLSGFAGILATGTSTPIVGVWLLVVVGTNIAGAISLTRSRWRIVVEPGALLRIGLALAPTVVILLSFRPAPMAYDARGIWWFHASWFEAGTETVRAAIADPATAFSHVDYPVGVPVLTGMLWRLTGGENLRQAEALSSTVTLLALSGSAVLFIRKWSQAKWLACVLGASLVGTAMLGLGDGYAPYGYLDVLIAGFVATAGVALFLCPPERGLVWLSGLCLVAASMTKTEGLLFALVLLTIHLLLNRLRWRSTLVIGGCVLLPALVWRTVVLGLNPHPVADLHPGGFVELARLGAEQLRRLRKAAPRVLVEAVLLLPATATAAVALLTGRNPERWSDEFKGIVGLTLSAWGALATLAVVYASGTTDIDWWLSTSAKRVVVTPVLLGLAVAAECVFVAQARERADSSRKVDFLPKRPGNF